MCVRGLQCIGVQNLGVLPEAQGGGPRGGTGIEDVPPESVVLFGIHRKSAGMEVGRRFLRRTHIPYSLIIMSILLASSQSSFPEDWCCLMLFSPLWFQQLSSIPPTKRGILAWKRAQNCHFGYGLVLLASDSCLSHHYSDECIVALGSTLSPTLLDHPTPTSLFLPRSLLAYRSSYRPQPIPPQKYGRPHPCLVPMPYPGPSFLCAILSK